MTNEGGYRRILTFISSNAVAGRFPLAVLQILLEERSPIQCHPCSLVK
jgi:hypothetical protein